MNIDLSNLSYYIQEQFKWLYFKIDQRNVICISGRGSGKSTAIVQKLIVNSFTMKGNILVIQNTYAAMKDASFAEITGWINDLGLSEYFDVTKSPLSIVNKITGVKFIFRGTDNFSRLKSMKGIETVFIEEADLITEESYDVINLSARGSNFDIKIYMCFNPSSPYTWLKTRIDDPDSYDCYIHKSFYYDNPYLDDNFIREMERIKITDYDKYKTVGLGEFGTKDGLCLKNHNIVNYIEGKYYGNNSYKGLGLDFGFNHLQAFVDLEYFADTNVLVINNVIATSGKTNTEFLELIPTKYRMLKNCYADSASPDKIKDFNNQSFRFVGANKLALKVGNYIEFMNSCSMIVVKSEAMEFKREAGVWEYISDTDTPKKVDDDINDAIRYALQPILMNRSGGLTTSGLVQF